MKLKKSTFGHIYNKFLSSKSLDISYHPAATTRTVINDLQLDTHLRSKISDQIPDQLFK